jgi:peroxiredoxin
MIVLVLMFIFSLLCCSSSDALTVSSGEVAPDFTLSSVEGESVSLSDYKGRAAVIIYWRTGQKRSLLALKDCRDILEKFKGKEVNVISIIAESDSQEEAKGILKDNGIEYPLFIDYNRKIYSNYGIRVYPSTVIIDKEGMIAYAMPSHPFTYKKILEEYIKKALGEIDEGELKEALSPHKEEPDRASLEAFRLYNLALKFTESGMIDLAVDTAIKSAEAKPDMSESHILLGFLYLQNKEADKALDSFNSALKLDPGSNDVKTGIAGALILKGEIDEAIKILEAAAVANPYPQMTYYELGRAYELKGEKDRSIEMYKKAIEKIIKKQVLPSSISKCQ